MKSNLYIIILSAFTILFFSTQGVSQYSNPAVIVTFWLNGILSIILLSVSLSKDGLSFRLIYWYFAYFFTFLIPYVCYRTGKWLQGDISVIHENLILQGNIFIALFNLLYITFHRLAYKKCNSKNKPLRIPFINQGKVLSGSNLSLLVVTIIPLAALIAYFMGEGIIFRTASSEKLASLGSGKVFVLLFGAIIRPMYFFVFFLAFLQFSTKKSLNSALLMLLCGILALLINFPTSLARFNILLFAIIIFYHLFNEKKHKDIYAFAFLAIGTFAGIIFDWVRRINIQNSRLSDNINWQYFFNGHYDAYENYILGIAYIKEQGITYGNQALGVIFSFVPRSIWESKPLSTGSYLFEDYFYMFSSNTNDNLAAPIYLEGYINFHIFGIALAAMVAGFVCGYLDSAIKRYFISTSKIKEVNFYSIFSLYITALIGLSIFIWRGSLQTGYTFFLGITFCMLFLYAICFKQINLKQPRNKAVGHQPTDSKRFKIK